MEAQEQSQKLRDLTASLEDYEGTINQFRELVLQLQSSVSNSMTSPKQVLMLNILRFSGNSTTFVLKLSRHRRNRLRRLLRLHRSCP